MSETPLVYELEDRDEFSLDPLTDSTRPGVQTALQGWMRPLEECDGDSPEPPPPTLLEFLDQHSMTLMFMAVMLVSSAVRWGV